MAEEERVERCTRQCRHVSADPHVRITMLRLHVAELVRLSQFVERLVVKQILHHSVGVQQSRPAGFLVDESRQNSCTEHITVGRLGAPVSRHAGTHSTVVVAEVLRRPERREAGTGH